MIKVQLVDARNATTAVPCIKAEMMGATVYGFDIETQDENRHAGLQAFNNKKRHVFDHRRTVITGFSIYVEGSDTAYYINTGHADVENRLPVSVLVEILESAPEGATCICHNAPFELVQVKQCTGYDLKNVLCSLQMAVSDHGPDEYDLQRFYAEPLSGIRSLIPDIIEHFRTYDKQRQGRELDADQAFVLGQFISKESKSNHSYNGYVKEIAWGYSLKRLALTFFGVKMTTYEEVLAAAGAEHMGQLTGEQVCAYGADDAYWCVQVYNHLLSKMLRENPAALVVFLESENPMIYVYADVWREGLRINQEEVYLRRNQERINYAQVLRDFKAALAPLLPFPAEPNAQLLQWQTKWYNEAKYQHLRQRIIDWIDSPDSDDDFEQCFQVSNPIGNAWAVEEGVPVPRSGKLNLTHYYQMRVILHDLLGHKLVRVSGDITTDQDARARMSVTFADDPQRLEVLRLITLMSGIEQSMKLYLTPYTQLMDPETECMYSVLSSMLASRRMGTRVPNPMQLAKRGETTYVRGFYLPDRDDHVIISADWSSVELVEIGEFSGDPGFAEVFGQIPYGDLHSGATVDCLRVDERYAWLTEDEFLTELKRGRNPMDRLLTDFNGKELPPGKWVKFMRTEIGKGANFNYWYSGALSTIGEKLNWDGPTMWEAVDRYRTRFSVAEEWRVRTIEEGCRNGFVTLPDGHRRVRIEATEQWFLSMRRKFAEICADPAVMQFADLALPRIQTRAKNQFVNTVIQGMCARLAKDSIIAVRAAMDKDAARFMLPIHDELLFSVHRDYVPEFIPLLRQGMCTHPKYMKTLPLHCNVAIGRTFKPYDASRPAFSQIELDEATPIEGIIGEEWEGKALPEDMYPDIVEWMMAA